MDFFNFLAEQFQDIGQTIIDALPASPIIWLESNETIKLYLSYVNWFIPFYSIVSVLEIWLVCVAFYYAIQAVLRWAKVVE